MNRKAQGRAIAIGVVTAIFAAMALAPGAQAKTINHTGKVVGDGTAKVKLKVKKKKKKLRRVARAKITNLKLNCRGTDIRKNIVFGSGQITGRKLKRKGSFSISSRNRDAQYSLSGTVKRKGKKVTGSFRVSGRFDTGGSRPERCSANGTFKTSA